MLFRSLWESAKVLDELVKAPDAGIPKELLKRAECVAVIPALKKAAIGFGGQYGRGAVTCKMDQGKGAFVPQQSDRNARAQIFAGMLGVVH